MKISGIIASLALLSAVPALPGEAAVSKTTEAGLRRSPALFAVGGVTPESLDRHEAEWCKRMGGELRKIGWRNLDPCKGVHWQVGGFSVKGQPLVYAEFGDPNSTNTTLILSGVHGDEITPHYVGVKLIHWLIENQHTLGNARVVVAPLVNPDGFYAAPRTRVNANGVDVNRNFDTQDWKEKALASWKKRFRSDPRRYPGPKPASEPETIFQEKLVEFVKPQKIMAIHSPLNFLDYDGPTPTALALERFPSEYVQECMKLRQRLKAVSGGFYPGSLGNFAGREMGIPTLTLELPTADPRKAEAYWKKFSQGIRTMIEFSMPKVSATQGLPPRLPASESSKNAEKNAKKGDPSTG